MVLRSACIVCCYLPYAYELCVVKNLYIEVYYSMNGSSDSTMINPLMNA